MTMRFPDPDLFPPSRLPESAQEAWASAWKLAPDDVRRDPRPVQAAAKKARQAVIDGKPIPRDAAEVLEHAAGKLLRHRGEARWFLTQSVMKVRSDLYADLYYAYVASRKASKKASLGLAEWVVRHARGSNLRKLLERFPEIRREWQQLAKKPYVPMSLVIEDVSELRGATKQRVVDELAADTWRDLREYKLSGLESSKTRRTRFSEGLFRILQGNVGEILAMQALKADFAELKRLHPDAKIYVNTRWKSGVESAKEFSDVVIATAPEGGGQITIHAVAEVKASRTGLVDGLAQMENTAKRQQAKKGTLEFDVGTIEVDLADGAFVAKETGARRFDKIGIDGRGPKGSADQFIVVPDDVRTPRALRDAGLAFPEALHHSPEKVMAGLVPAELHDLPVDVYFRPFVFELDGNAMAMTHEQLISLVVEVASSFRVER